MGWKHIYTLQRGAPSTKERVGDMNRFKFSKEVIEYNIKKNDEKVGSKK